MQASASTALPPPPADPLAALLAGAQEVHDYPAAQLIQSLRDAQLEPGRLCEILIEVLARWTSHLECALRDTPAEDGPWGPIRLRVMDETHALGRLRALAELLRHAAQAWGPERPGAAGSSGGL